MFRMYPVFFVVWLGGLAVSLVPFLLKYNSTTTAAVQGGGIRGHTFLPVPGQCLVTIHELVALFGHPSTMPARALLFASG